ncbi:unnamed protein product [Rhizophagus irregularis]|nr:unnamed protein product [Rhizophagus irregularis]
MVPFTWINPSINIIEEEEDDDYKDRILVNKNARKKVKKEGIRLLGRNIYISNQKIEEYYKTPSEDVRKHFEKATEVDGRDRKTPRQKCNYCGNDIIDLIDRLKDHSIECKSLPEDLKLINIIIKCLNFYCKICIT